MERSDKNKELYSYEVIHKGGEDILTFNYKGAQFSPSISDSSEVMERTVNALIENPNASRVIFEQEKIVVIKRATDKILNIIQNLYLKELDEITIILNSENLDKKSKLRTFFEKDKKLICIPFYPDNDQILLKLTYNFLRDKNISISPSNMNLIVNKCSGEREWLFNELQKIEHFVKNGKILY